MAASAPTAATARPPPGWRLYAIGDVHGHIGLLDRLLDRIGADIDRHGDATAHLVFLGDYVDRGPDSRAVVERLSGLAAGPVACTFLKGNHEQMLLETLDDPATLDLWLINGGAETLLSYDVDLGLLDSPAALMAAFARALPPRHREFLHRLKLWTRLGDYLFVHAGVRPGLPIDRQRPMDLLWIRDPFLTSTGDLGAVVVHGHTIVPRPEIRANRIGIDTGVYAYGTLTAAVLAGGEPTFLSVSA